MSSAHILAEARRLSQLMLETADLSKDLFAEIAHEVAVPVPIARALCLLENSASMTELAGMLACDKSYITPLADQMETLGLVQRVSGPDRRTKLLQLTDAGNTKREQIGDKVTQVNPIILALNPDERATFEAMLVRILATSPQIQTDKPKR